MDPFGAVPVDKTDFVIIFQYLENLYIYPPKGTAKAVPDGVHLTVFPFYM